MIRCFTVMGAPQGKARARTVKRGGHTHSYTPTKTVQYEASVAEAYKVSNPAAEPIRGPLEVKIEAYMPIPTSWPRSKKAKALAEMIAPTVKPDADNILKAVSDALNGVAWVDDKQITVAKIRKHYGLMPRIDVEIWYNET